MTARWWSRPALSGLPGGHRAFSEHGAGLRGQPEAVVRIPAADRDVLGPGGRGGRGPVRGLAARAGGQRDRAGGRTGSAARRRSTGIWLGSSASMTIMRDRSGGRCPAGLVARISRVPTSRSCITWTRPGRSRSASAARAAAHAAHLGAPSRSGRRSWRRVSICGTSFLLSLLASGTGMRAGQALGLRRCDFVSRKREVHIVPRADNANRARAKMRSAVVVPVSTPLVRLYSNTCTSSTAASTRTTCS